MRFTFFLSCALLGETALSLSFPHFGRFHGRRHDPFVGKLEGRDGTTATQYDYIVVGAGPGGGPLAANLAIAGYKVLLIDAGGDDGTATQELVPALHPFSSEFNATAWTFFVNHYSDLNTQKKDSKMVYQLADGTRYIGLNPPSGAIPLGIDYPRASTLGGCSRHNAMITMYPHDSDWSYIANITGDSSWAPDQMRKKFVAIENNQYLPSSVVGHGYGGWLTTSLTSLTLVLQDAKFLNLVLSVLNTVGSLVTTVAGLAKLLILDINAPTQASQPGYYQVPIAVQNGVRSSPRDFILSTANAVNSDGSRKYYLDIKLNTLVSSIVFDQSGTQPRAVGVKYIEGKNLYRAHTFSSSATVTNTGAVNATREVILAAGTFNTPQLLKLSGVGPAAELNSFGIPVVVNLPGVGTNMQDRYENAVVSAAQADYALTSSCTFLSSYPDPCLDQWTNGLDEITKGVYATNGVAISRVIKSSVSTGEPDIVVLGTPATFKGYYPGYAKDGYADKKHWSWLILKAHSRNSAGTVTLTSTDPRDMPNITFNSFAQGGDSDVQALYEGVQWARQAMTNYNPITGAFTESWPGSSTSTADQVKQWIRNEAWGHHASCTCPIGAASDPMAVLDSNFKVRGTTGLRVVDASVFPKIPGYFIAVPTYMISQKASEVIIADAKASK
ncbi:hypothetical protein BX600DRAFT_479523 [Xylariales sp. PMI_506]|nr:hypothetical protein BX600DRAFT_479523 [Xylariales sp. PMI_506]